MSSFTSIKKILVSILGVGGFVLFILLFFAGKLDILGFFVLLIGLGLFCVLFFNVDNVKKIYVETKLIKVMLELKQEVRQSMVELEEAKQDFEEHAKKEISVPDEKQKMAFITEPIVLKLVETLDRFLGETRDRMSELEEAKFYFEKYTKKEISVTVEKQKIMHKITKPKVSKLEATLDRVEVLTEKAEKLLTGKAEGKSNAEADLTVIKNNKTDTDNNKS